MYGFHQGLLEAKRDTKRQGHSLSALEELSDARLGGKTMFMNPFPFNQTSALHGGAGGL